MTLFDYIVIGAGSAGCVVASRLSEDPSLEICLIEAGQAGDFLLDVPGALLRSSTEPRYNWNFHTEPERGVNDRRLFWSQGRVIGGSSAINGMVYTRGAPSDYDQWAGLGCPGWDFETVLPYFRKSEASDRGASRWHGDIGPMAVSRGAPQVALLERLLGAAANAGHQISDDFNAGDPTGFGHFDRTIGGSLRSSTARAFLRPARRRSNLHCLAGILVERLIIEGERAIGIECVRNNQPFVVHAARELIICAGALKSPQLLMLSGIGPADHLHDHGIAVAVDRPAVGQNLGNHALFPMSFSCSEPISAYSHATVSGAALALARYAATGKGILAQTPISTGGFLKTNQGLPTADIQVQAMVGLAGQVGQSLWARLPKQHGFTLMVNQCRPKSRGTVRLRSSSPSVAPAITSAILTDADDVSVLAEGLDRLRDVLNDPILASILSPIAGALPSDRRDMHARIRECSYLAFHGTGTCRMGSDEGAVVDPELRVRGIKGLRIADASIIPTVLGANMNAPAIMVGERCADFIASQASVS